MTAVPRSLFFASDREDTPEGLITLDDGSHYVDPDYLLHTPEFRHHLDEVRETAKDYAAHQTTPAAPNGS